MWLMRKKGCFFLFFWGNWGHVNSHVTYHFNWNYFFWCYLNCWMQKIKLLVHVNNWSIFFRTCVGKCNCYAMLVALRCWIVIIKFVFIRGFHFCMSSFPLNFLHFLEIDILNCWKNSSYIFIWKLIAPVVGKKQLWCWNTYQDNLYYSPSYFFLIHLDIHQNIRYSISNDW